MSEIADLGTQIENALNDPKGLERIYREAVVRGRETDFRSAIGKRISQGMSNTLLTSWGYRLDLLPIDARAGETVAVVSTESRSWGLAISISLILGLLWAIFAGGKQPFPFPRVSAPLFWLAWAPTTALAILAFLVWSGRDQERLARQCVVGAFLVGIVLLAAWPAWNRKDPVAELTASYLPVVSWFAVGLAATIGLPDMVRQRMGFVLKSVETLLTAGMYVAGAGIFGALTLGIFEVLGIRIPERWIATGAAFAFGASPVLAIMSIYNPRENPASQDFSLGLTRLARLLARLLLAPALGVLLVYVLWFIPRYFWRAFQERDVLMVYNGSIFAIIALLVLTLPHEQEQLSAAWRRVLRYGLLAAATLAFALNVYALAAVVDRIVKYGLSANRHTVSGWNLVTLVMLATILLGQWRVSHAAWTARFKESFTRSLPLAAIWGLWALIATPWFW